MCRRVECRTCGKPSFAGCGAHVEQVLADVPRGERCRCREQADKGAAPGGQGEKRSWLSGLFGK